MNFQTSSHCQRWLFTPEALVRACTGHYLLAKKSHVFIVRL